MACTVVASARAQLANHGRDAQHTDLQPGLRAPSEARHFITHVLSEALGADDLAVVHLLVSEVVTNVVLHGRTAMRLGISRLDGQVLVTVQDANPAGPPEPGMPPAERLTESGRGMALLEALASDSGWTHLPDGVGKVVWFTVDRAGLAVTGA